MLWDRGHYTVSGVSPEKAYQQGKIHLALVGEKCVGEWTLVRLRRRSGDKKMNWLLIKNSAPAHRAPMTGAARDLSVSSGRSMEEIGGGGRANARRNVERPTFNTQRSRTSGGKRVPGTKRQRTKAVGGVSSPRGKAGTKPKRGGAAPPASRRLAPAKFIAPMKALSVDEIPAGEWRLEIKFDGYRAIALLNGGRIELWSRNHKPLTGDYPEVVEALEAVRCTNAVIDGEIVALDAQGHSRFQLLQNRSAASRPPIVYYVFDLLHHDGRSLLDVPIEERRMALEVLVGKGSDALRVSPVFDTAPDTLMREARKKGLEGIIAKTRGSFYEPDSRSGRWLKCKLHGEQEFVVGGFTPPQKSRQHFGAILIGYYEGKELIYAGKVGSGFDSDQLASLHREFLKRRIDACPFANLPQPRKPRYGLGMTRSAMREVTWLEPELVAQVRFTEWTNEGSLRHPVFLGLREDKRAQEVVRESQGKAER
jgi:bifunctional non-homologous end joining protein LigD